MMGYDFHRQKPIDEYIVDFFCPELGLIIEIDGESHTDRIKDQRRQERLESLGFHFLRFWDEGTHNESPLREGCPAALLTGGVCHPLREGCSLQRRGALSTGKKVMGRSTDCVDAPERPGIQ